MLHDLIEKGRISLKTDFLVIGAGTVGLPTALLLAERTGKRVVCLESGGVHQVESTHPFNDVVHNSMVYAGAALGRFRCLGGTSTRWGGAFAPFLEGDTLGADWPIRSSELATYVKEVEHLFGLETGEYADTSFPIDLGNTYINRLAKWPAFKKRNVATLLSESFNNSATADIWINAHVTHLNVGADSVEIVARSTKGDEIFIHGEKLIIAGGAIESTRLLLLMDQWHGGVISRTSPTLGKYFADHISMPVAEVIPNSPSKLNRIIGFRFGPKGSMRNIRFEMSSNAKERNTHPPHFIHINFSSDQKNGFDALRDMFRALQRRSFPTASVFFQLLRNTPWLFKAIWWRYIRRRLLFPDKARFFVNAVVEQAALPSRKITLSAKSKDAFGLPLAEINWNINQDDYRALRSCSELFERNWQSSGLANLGKWQWLDAEQSHQNPEGVFHPTGSTRMSDVPEKGVVDRNLRLFSMPNVQILATSVLPTGGGSNPTMMLMALAMRLVSQHASGDVGKTQ